MTGVSMGDALAIFCFSLALGLLAPIPLDIGVIKLGGLGAFVAYGASRDVALSAMPVNHLFSTGASLALARLVIGLLRSEAPALYTRAGGRFALSEPPCARRQPGAWLTVDALGATTSRARGLTRGLTRPRCPG